MNFECLGIWSLIAFSCYSHGVIYMLIFNYTFMLSNIRKDETDYNYSIVYYLIRYIMYINLLTKT